MLKVFSNHHPLSAVCQYATAGNIRVFLSALVCVFVPYRGCGEAARRRHSSTRTDSISRAQRENTRVQQLDQLHVLLQQDVLRQQTSQRRLAESRILPKNTRRSTQTQCKAMYLLTASDIEFLYCNA